MLPADYSCHSDARLHLSTRKVFLLRTTIQPTLKNFLMWVILFLHEALQLWFTLFTLYYMSSSCIIMPALYVCTIRPPFDFTTCVCFATVAQISFIQKSQPISVDFVGSPISEIRFVFFCACSLRLLFRC